MSISEQEQRIARLRQKLKEWETSFAVAHEGRKPGREDVKKNPEIGKISNRKMQPSFQLLNISQLRDTKIITRSANPYRSLTIQMPAPLPKESTLAPRPMSLPTLRKPRSSAKSCWKHLIRL